MKLIELLRQPDEWDHDTTIYVARPWSCDADAILVRPAPDTTEPVERGGKSYEYFLETFIAREFMEEYAASDEGGGAPELKRCERLISYAVDDA